MSKVLAAANKRLETSADKEPTVMYPGQVRSALKRNINALAAVMETAYPKVHEQMPQNPLQATQKDMERILGVLRKAGDKKNIQLALTTYALMIVYGTINV